LIEVLNYLPSASEMTMERIHTYTAFFDQKRQA